MALTTAEIAAALRITTDPSSPPAEPLLGILHRQLQAAINQVNRYAPNAPEVDKDEAVVRMVGYLYEMPLARAPFVLSGARDLLKDSHESLVVPLGVTPQVATTTTPESSLTPTHPVHPGTHNRFMGWSDDSAVDAAELAAGAAFQTDVLTIPARAVAGYLWAAFDASIGFPTSAFRQGNPTNVIGGWRQQSGQLTRGTEAVVILITTSAQNPNIAGITYTFGYGP